MAHNLSIPGLQANYSQIPAAFEFYDSRFLNITGPAPKLEVLLENNDFPFAHEASVFIPSTDELFMTSNIFTDPVTNQSTVKISKVSLSSNPVTSEVINSTIPLANGGVNNGNGILFCGQGTLNESGGLFQMSIESPYESEQLVSGFYGREFNSLNDVVVHSDGSMWFTDPIYGSKQGIRPSPQLPNQVYRYDPATGNVRVVADGFGRPNGISFSPDEKTVYITDTAYTAGDGTTDPTKPSTIYAFDLTTIHGETFLTNHRVFAMADTGIPDGIKTDMNGNVYAGCGDGINVWSPGGVLLGKILIKNGASNFSFGRNGLMFIMNENKLWTAQLSSLVKGALLKI
ncbi:calcium-dependent phosphotriesterase [Aspergillus sclerotiicarbonarius CBS 121057]|uniref:Calcium-dependent phosphotriesterase n=1 Tax=Aspergillus sclerotiicarbonarius (strain CBS 121057 / IBT 28362) TaxID=1448318 RepID=A0A319EI42_ASPSB|nr:calcium-dependent phosphotriesterase [Aspergillus sclerotiicarbonarius CBS 121057]